MTTPHTIKIDNVEYIKNTQAQPPTPTQIIVADRGWVFVGHTTKTNDGLTITDAKCIRVWGTDSEKPGLGYLAINGPTPKTVLDPCGVIHVPLHSVIATFDTDTHKWQ